MAIRKFSSVEVKEMMGHRSVTTTAKYLHHVPRIDDVARLTNLLTAASEVDARSIGG